MNKTYDIVGRPLFMLKSEMGDKAMNFNIELWTDMAIAFETGRTAHAINAIHLIREQCLMDFLGEEYNEEW